MAWPPTESELLEAHMPFNAAGEWMGIPCFESEMCEPLVEKGLLKVADNSDERDIVWSTLYVLTNEGRATVERQRNADTP